MIRESAARAMVLLAATLFATPGRASPPAPPATAQGTGTELRLAEGPLAGVAFRTPAPVAVTMLGGSGFLSLFVQPVDPPPGIVGVALTGLAPGSVWYLYADGVPDPLVVTADAAGAVELPLDLSTERVLRLQARPSTYTLLNNATGGDCTKIGTWNWAARTCTLDRDVSETIQFAKTAWGLTLDGAGHVLTHPYTGVYADDPDSIVVRNLVVDGAGTGVGIYFIRSDYSLVDNCTVRNAGLGIQTWINRTLTVRNSRIQNVGTGVDARLSGGPVLTGMDIGPVAGAAIYFHIVGGTLRNSVVHDAAIALYGTNNWFGAYNNVFRDCEQISTGAGNLVLGAAAAPGPNIVGGPFVGGNFYTRTDGTGFSDTARDVSPHDGFADQPYEAAPGRVDALPLVIYRAYVNYPPELAAIGDRTVAEGETLTFALSATDPNPGDALTFSAANLPPGASFDPTTATFSWTPGYDQAGFYPAVQFTVTDDGVPVELDVELVSITVGNTNRPPVFDPVGPQSVTEYDTLGFAVRAADPDGDAIRLEAGPLPAGASFDPALGVFSWRPDGTQAGVYPIRFYAVDSGEPPLTAELGVVVTVGQVTSPLELIGELVAEIDARIPPGPELNSYRANVKKVEIFLLEGKLTPAVNEVRAFIQKVEQDLAHGAVPAEDGAYLLMMANDLLALLQG